MSDYPDVTVTTYNADGSIINTYTAPISDKFRMTMEAEWSLNPLQIMFIAPRWDKMLKALQSDDIEYFDRMLNSDRYKHAFRNMNINEAIDRYECFIENLAIEGTRQEGEVIKTSTQGWVYQCHDGCLCNMELKSTRDSKTVWHECPHCHYEIRYI